jgi:ribose-phosphate pyrophosphokinase
MPGGDAVQGNLEFFTFSDCEALARGVADRLEMPLRPIEVHSFPDRESLVRAESKMHDRALIFRSLDDPNQKLIEVLFAADALRRQGVREIGLVAPYLGYMRQDQVFLPGQSLSQRVVADLLGGAFDDVLTVEAHLHRIRQLNEIFACPARSISAAPAITDWLRASPGTSLIVGPDAESEPWVRAIAAEAKLNWLVASKHRQGDREVRIDLPPLPADARSVWIVDDIGSSGTTLEAVARLLKERGVAEIGAIVVHALLDPDTPRRLQNAGIARLVSSDSVAHSSNEIGLAPLLAMEIERRWSSREVA